MPSLTETCAERFLRQYTEQYHCGFEELDFRNKAFLAEADIRIQPYIRSTAGHLVDQLPEFHDELPGCYGSLGYVAGEAERCLEKAKAGLPASGAPLADMFKHKIITGALDFLEERGDLLAIDAATLFETSEIDQIRAGRPMIRRANGFGYWPPDGLLRAIIRKTTISPDFNPHQQGVYAFLQLAEIQWNYDDFISFSQRIVREIRNSRATTPNDRIGIVMNCQDPRFANIFPQRQQLLS